MKNYETMTANNNMKNYETMTANQVLTAIENEPENTEVTEMEKELASEPDVDLDSLVQETGSLKGFPITD